jgi:hypothetical protein
MAVHSDPAASGESQSVFGEFPFKPRLASGKGLGKAAAIDQAWHRQDEAYQTCPSGALPLSD